MKIELSAHDSHHELLSRYLGQLNEEVTAETEIMVIAGDWAHQIAYNKHCQIFNKRFQKKPWAIIYCKHKVDVVIAYRLAVALKLPVRIRAGGHDHEGECIDTNAILIDVSRMDVVDVDKNGLATIGPGNIFKNLTTKLADEDVMIPHGTCATVGISGFIMGGGWGPWTRKYGMCCERLMGVDIVLGNGHSAIINADGDNVPDLLWALRGGGPMSYGLVTEFRVQTFPLPKVLIRFNLDWNLYPDEFCDEPTCSYPTIQVLKAWENVIESDQTSRLIGTNLQVNGKPASGDSFDYETVCHNCRMYGYWEGDEDSLNAFIEEWFKGVEPNHIDINPNHGGTESNSAYGDQLMSDWARVSYHKVLEARYRNGENVTVESEEHRQLLLEGKPLPPDYDDPAPHKITSRLVDTQGLGNEGYKAFLQSLTSELILEGNRKLGLFTYVTLGAIVGDYYRENPEGGNSAFPYKDKLYTIQYQTWWNTHESEAKEKQNNYVYNRTNRALDWMEVARDYNIPNTSGAFISFKDSSIPTKTYFAQNYDELVRIKEDCVEDPYNHLRIRKSII
ncbi:MAG: FAD-dependent oxidoreductase [Roseivirga sp.]|uniref:FAD-binding oxidoreductase n=1 Tax=Roseivirga sp. TaxID=1964215 RepID=UPI001B16BEFC|nr:FAD-dependent oxidoreductase [Roseivirga sp.]MBO6660030.1 FAD-dependent oxidoreductase [Roseivirga sp.]MBO6907233.1 FAD-dependent oxidoreductase [Roseivirga sp.]